MRGPVQRRHAVALCGVDVGALLQQPRTASTSLPCAAMRPAPLADRRPARRTALRTVHATAIDEDRERACCTCRELSCQFPSRTWCWAARVQLHRAACCRRTARSRGPPSASPRAWRSPSACRRRRLTCRLPFSAPAGVAGEQQRAALVVVHVRVAHRRSVDDRRVLEQIALAIGGLLQPIEEVRQQADVVAVDLRELENALVAILVMRRDVEAGGDAGIADRRDSRRRGSS